MIEAAEEVVNKLSNAEKNQLAGESLKRYLDLISNGGTPEQVEQCLGKLSQSLKTTGANENDVANLEFTLAGNTLLRLSNDLEGNVDAMDVLVNSTVIKARKDLAPPWDKVQAKDFRDTVQSRNQPVINRAIRTAQG